MARVAAHKIGAASFPKLPGLPSAFKPRAGGVVKEPHLPAVTQKYTPPAKVTGGKNRLPAVKTKGAPAKTSIASRSTYSGPTGGQGGSRSTPGPRAVPNMPLGGFSSPAKG